MPRSKSLESEQLRYLKRRENLANLVIALGSVSASAWIAAIRAEPAEHLLGLDQTTFYTVIAVAALVMALVTIIIMIVGHLRATTLWGPKYTWTVNSASLEAKSFSDWRDTTRDSASQMKELI